MFTFSHVSFKRDTCCSITLFKNDWHAYLYVLFKNDWLTCHYVLLKRDWHACHYMLFKNFAQKGLAHLPLAMCHSRGIGNLALLPLAMCYSRGIGSLARFAIACSKTWAH